MSVVYRFYACCAFVVRMRNVFFISVICVFVVCFISYICVASFHPSVPPIREITALEPVHFLINLFASGVNPFGWLSFAVGAAFWMFLVLSVIPFVLSKY